MMNRKQFLGAIGAAAGTGQNAPEQQTAAADTGRRFREQWIATLVRNLESRVEEPVRTALMQDCGRACARRDSVEKIAAPCRGDVGMLVERLARHVGRENARMEGTTVHLAYPKCYCPLVGQGPPRLPDTWCECSRGWVLEMFETVAGKPVQVELLESIRRGGARCRFLIRL